MFCSACGTENENTQAYCRSCGRALTQSQPGTPASDEGVASLTPGTAIDRGRYVIRRTLGSGGMGTVYLAWDNEVEREVVIKIPHPRLLDSPDFARRFEDEIRSQTQFSHAGIVHVYGRGREGHLPFLVVQYLSGGSLSDRLDPNAPSRPEELSGWLPQVATALDSLHARGALHRDIKPDNILFDEHDFPYLADFGIAKVISDSTQTGHETNTGMMVGTPAYLAPEYVDREFSPACDQYSLAVVVYRALSGTFPHNAPTAERLMIEKVTKPPRPLVEVAPRVDPRVSEVVMRALARAPGERFPSCTAFAESFAAAARGAVVALPASEAPTVHSEAPTIRSRRSSIDTDVLALPDRPAPQPTRRPRRALRVALLLLLAGVALALPSTLGLFDDGDAGSPPVVDASDRALAGKPLDEPVEPERSPLAEASSPTPAPEQRPGRPAPVASPEEPPLPEPPPAAPEPPPEPRLAQQAPEAAPEPAEPTAAEPAAESGGVRKVPVLVGGGLAGAAAAAGVLAPGGGAPAPGASGLEQLMAARPGTTGASSAGASSPGTAGSGSASGSGSAGSGTSSKPGVRRAPQPSSSGSGATDGAAQLVAARPGNAVASGAGVVGRRLSSLQDGFDSESLEAGEPSPGEALRAEEPEPQQLAAVRPEALDPAARSSDGSSGDPSEEPEAPPQRSLSQRARDAIQDYEAAYEARDIERLGSVWQLTERQRESLGRFFEDADEVDVAIDIRSIEVDGDRVRVDFDQELRASNVPRSRRTLSAELAPGPGDRLQISSIRAR